MKLNQCCCFTPKWEASPFSSPREKRQQPSRRKRSPVEQQHVLDPARKAVLEQSPDSAGSGVDDLGVEAGKPSCRTWAARPMFLRLREGSRALLPADQSPLLGLGTPSGQAGREVMPNMGLLQQMVVTDLPAHRQPLWQGRAPYGLQELQERANPASQPCPVSGALWAGVEPLPQNPYTSARCADPSHGHHSLWGLGQGWTHPNTAVWHRSDQSGHKGPISFHDHQIQPKLIAQV